MCTMYMLIMYRAPARHAAGRPHHYYLLLFTTIYCNFFFLKASAPDQPNEWVRPLVSTADTPDSCIEANRHCSCNQIRRQAGALASVFVLLYQ